MSDIDLVIADFAERSLVAAMTGFGRYLRQHVKVDSVTVEEWNRYAKILKEYMDAAVSPAMKEARESFAAHSSAIASSITFLATMELAGIAAAREALGHTEPTSKTEGK